MGKATRRAGALRRYRQELNRRSRSAVLYGVLGLFWMLFGLWALWSAGFETAHPAFLSGALLGGLGALLVVLSLLSLHRVRREYRRVMGDSAG